MKSNHYELRHKAYMQENTFSHQKHFNRLFCHYRIKHYFNKTSEFLARYKLLLAFIVCLVIPGMHNLPQMGVPFFAIVDPTASISVKLGCIGIILFFSLMLTNAQADCITGGPFRAYLNGFGIAPETHKKIDLLIVALSLNFLWLPIGLGAGLIYTFSTSASMALSLFCLYLSFTMNYLILLLSHLYDHRKRLLLLLVNLFTLSFLSSLKIILVNFTGAALISWLGLILLWTTKPLQKGQRTTSLATKGQDKQLEPLTVFFTIQYAVYKQHKKPFLNRILAATLINSSLIFLTAAEHFNQGNSGFFLTIIGLNGFILSTLFIIFQQEENRYQLFHSLYPYQKACKYAKETILIIALFIMSGLPLLLYLAAYASNLGWLIGTAYLIGFLPLAINRALYKMSLRFCLFVSLINCMVWVMAQHWILGVIFE